MTTALTTAGGSSRGSGGSRGSGRLQGLAAADDPDADVRAYARRSLGGR